MIVACLALLVALSGTGVAATQLARNSVGTPQLRDNAVTNAKVRNNAINSSKVAARSLLRSDFAPGQLPAGPVGPQGPAGPAGAAGAAGPAGPAGVVGPVTVRQASVNVPGSDSDKGVNGPNGFWNTRTVNVNCNSNERAMSAGTGWSADADNLEMATVYMKPVFTGTGPVTGFTAKGANNAHDGENHTFSLYVLCYTAS
jgi:hypothetical protein